MKSKIRYIAMAIAVFAMAMLGFNSIIAYGAGKIELESGTRTTNAGNEVVLNISIKENSGLAGFQFQVKYDDALTLVSATGLNDAISAESYVYEKDNIVRYILAEEKNYTGSGDILKLHFLVDKDAKPGEYNVTILDVIAIDSSLQQQNVSITNGCIIVTEDVVIPSDDVKLDKEETSESEDELSNVDKENNDETTDTQSNIKNDPTSETTIKDDEISSNTEEYAERGVNRKETSIVPILAIIIIATVVILLVSLIIIRYKKLTNIILLVLWVGIGCLLTSGESTIAASYPKVNPENTSTFYYYKQLDNYSNAESMKKLYNDMLDICWDFYNSTEDATAIVNASGNTEYFIPQTLKTSDYMFSDKELDIVEDALFHDMPLFYFLSFRINWYEDENVIYTGYTVVEGDTIRLQITNNTSDTGVSKYYDGERRKECKAIIEANVYKYYNETKGKTAYEKQQIIFDGICMNSDYNSAEQMVSYAHTVVGNFEGKSVVCEGYTKTANLLLNYCGVDTIDISGVAGPSGEEKHVWNSVKLDDGNWYLCDLTWSDTTNNYTISASSILWEERTCNGYYVNVPESEFYLNHTPWSSVNLPQFADTTKYYDSYDVYVNRDIKNNNTEAEIKDIVCEVIKNELISGNTYVSIWFDDYEYFRPFASLVVASMDSILEEVYKHTGVRYKMLGAYNYSCTGVKELNDGTGNNYMVMDMAIPFCVSKEVGDYTVDASYRINGQDCVAITDVRVEGDAYLELPSKIDGKPVIMYISGEDALVYDELVTPNTMLVLYNGCFRYGKMTSVRLNEGLKTIDYGAFHDCLNLKSVYVPNSVTTIASYALGYYYEGDVRTKISGFTIYGYVGSAAYDYAVNNGFEFVAVTKPPVFCGDVNGDNTINRADGMDIKKYIVKLLNAINTEAADLNCDGSIDVIDAVKLMKKVHNVR